MIILVLKILGWYILHWFIHYKILMYETMLIDGEDMSCPKSRTCASIFSLIPFVASAIILYGIILIIKDKVCFSNFLTFVDNIGKKEVKIVKEKIKEHKKVKKIKKAEKDKIKNRFDILDL